MSATMEIGLESLDGRLDTVIVAKTSNNICGRMIPTNWLQIKDQWKHLRDIPKLGRSYWFRLLQPAVSYERGSWR